MTSPGPDPTTPGPYGSTPYGQQPYGEQPYGQQPYGGPPAAYGYDDPPPGYGPQYAPGYPPGFYAAPPPPPGIVLIPGAPPLQAASPGRRALGRLIDSAGYLVVLAGGIAAMAAILVHDARSVDYSYGYPGLGFLWIYPVLGGVWLVIAGYEWLTIGLTGATVGDRLMGVRFVNTRDGGPPGLGRAAGRAALLGVSVMVCYGLIFLLLLLSMFFDNQPGRYQGWIDKLCGLQAVSTRE